MSTQRQIENKPYPTTPDGRYFVVRGRLWRTSNPALTDDERTSLIRELMSARRSVRSAESDGDVRTDARRRVHAVKIALGERGPAWWTDGAPDYSRHMAKNTPYAEWFESLTITGEKVRRSP